MFSPERRAQIERAKDGTPTTSSFILWIPLFLFIAWMCKPDTYVAPHIVEMPETTLKIFGWTLL